MLRIRPRITPRTPPPGEKKRQPSDHTLKKGLTFDPTTGRLRAMTADEILALPEHLRPKQSKALGTSEPPPPPESDDPVSVEEAKEEIRKIIASKEYLNGVRKRMKAGTCDKAVELYLLQFSLGKIPDSDNTKLPTSLDLSNLSDEQLEMLDRVDKALTQSKNNGNSDTQSETTPRTGGSSTASC